MQRWAHCVVGGGIVGLAVAAKLSSFGSTIVLEKNSCLLQETSSHNSGVVHAGIYYPTDSLKAAMCVAGNKAIWALHQRQPDLIRARRCGKWIGTTSPEEEPVLAGLIRNMEALGVPHRLVSTAEARALEPGVRMSTIVESPNSGIIDVHSLGEFFTATLEQNRHLDSAGRQHFVSSTGQSPSEQENLVATSCAVTQITRGTNGYVVATNDGAEFEAGSVINAAGLHTDAVNALVFGAGSSPSEYKLHFCKGRYLRYVGPSTPRLVSRLVYPAPLPNIKGLGFHATIDLDGAVRFGPDAHYVPRNDDYSLGADDDALIAELLPHAQKYLPSLGTQQLVCDYAGIRPKLSSDGAPARDFVVAEESGRGFPRVVSLIGIESPGLTCAMPIADRVAHLLGYPDASWW